MVYSDEPELKADWLGTIFWMKYDAFDSDSIRVGTGSVDLKLIEEMHAAQQTT